MIEGQPRYIVRSTSTIWIPAVAGGRGVFVGNGDILPEWTDKSTIDRYLRQGAIVRLVSPGAHATAASC
jgi:hypothetical protein